MNEIDDSELERAFAHAPQANFQVVYDRYSGPLFRFLYRFTLNNQASEEILQDIFVELISGKYKPKELGTLKSWLFTIAKNRGLNHRKKSVNTGHEEITELTSPQNLEEDTIYKGLLIHLERAEKILPEELKTTWDLRKHGHDYNEIANLLSIPVGTVKSRFSRLVEYLRKELSP